MWWYIDGAGQQRGPIDPAECSHLIASGKIKPDTLLWSEGWPEWKAAQLVFPFPARGVQPPPPPPAATNSDYQAEKRRARRRALKRIGAVGGALVAVIAILQGPRTLNELHETACEWGLPLASTISDCEVYAEKEGSRTAAYDGRLQDLRVAVMDGDTKTLDRLRRKGMKLRKDDFCDLFNVHYLDYFLGQSLDRLRDTVSPVTSPDRVLALLPFTEGTPACSSSTIALVGDGSEVPFDRLALDIAATRSLMDGICDSKPDVMNERWGRAADIINAIHAGREPSAAFREGVKAYSQGLAETRSATPNDRAKTCWISQTSGGPTPLKFAKDVAVLCRSGATSAARSMAARFRGGEGEDEIRQKCVGIAGRMVTPTPQVDQALSAWGSGS